MTKGNRQGSFRQSTIDVFALITIDKKKNVSLFNLFNLFNATMRYLSKISIRGIANHCPVRLPVSSPAEHNTVPNSEVFV